MKKLGKLMLILCLVAVLAVTVAACNEKGSENPGGGGGNGGGNGTRYSIQAPSASDVFTVEGLPDGAHEGDVITFKVNLTHPDDSVINKVELAYNQSIKYEVLTAGADGSYSFTMPAETVRLTVDADYYPDTAEDNFLTWSPANETTIEKWVPVSDDDQYYSDHAKLVANVSKVPSGTGGYFHVHEQRAFSLDQDVIPDDALSVTFAQKDSNTTSFTVSIDRSKVDVGTAKIVLIVENGQKFGDESVLVCTVTVTEPEPIVSVEKWTATVKFQMVNYEVEVFQFEDLDHEENTDAKQYQSFFKPGHVNSPQYTVDDDNYATLTIEYVPGHRYEITIYVSLTGEGEQLYIGMDTSSDGAEYRNDELTFDKDNGSITFTLSRF